MAETLVLLHGFAGTHRGWDDVVARLDRQRYRPLTLDLRGHGSARDRRPISFEACVQDVLDAAPPRFALAGYSLGGRVALHVALAAPQRVSRLTLISTTAGIDDAAARAARRADDECLAEELLRDGIEAFAQRWSGSPLFAADPPSVRAAAAADIRRNDAGALAGVLRGVGTGCMAPLWARLGEIGAPTAVLAGARDAKFTALAQRLTAGVPDAQINVLEGGGHALAREMPKHVAALLQSF